MRGQTSVRLAGLALTALMAALPFQGTVSASAASRHGQALPASSAALEKGYAVAISGHFAIVGAPGKAGANGVRGSRGAAYIYAESDGRWSKQATFTDGAADGFGHTVAISGNEAVVGALNQFWVFTRSGSAWHRTGPLQAGVLSGSNYIQAIAVFRHAVIVGMPRADHGAGSVEVFWNGRGGWSPKAQLPTPAGEIAFGSSVAISGRTVVIGADTNSGAGAVHIIVHETRTGGDWHQLQKITGSGHRLFGAAVAISGTTIAIGAPGTGAGNGAVFVFQRGTGGWTQRARINPPGKGRSAEFGHALALSGGRLLIGADNQTERRCGAAFEYEPSGSAWRNTAEVFNPGCSQGDEFGFAIGLSGSTAITGAPGWHNSAGAAYVEAVP